MRRGASVVEFGFISMLYFTIVYGIFEFAWITQRRNALFNGCNQGSRQAAVGATVSQTKDAVRTKAQMDSTLLPDSNIYILFNSSDLGASPPSDPSQASTASPVSGWAPMTDDPNTGTPPLANGVPAGRPVLVVVYNWRYRLLSGSLFAWLSPDASATVPMTVRSVTRRE
jgi:Flp pilus assembly protein TadG